MKPAALIHANIVAEQETTRLIENIEAKQKQVEELTIAIETLKSEVDVFERRYTAHISRYYLELDKVELEMKEYRLRLQLRRENVSEEEIEARVESCFRASRARVNAYEAVNESEPTPIEDKLPDTKAKHLQDLYRKLAKRHHPDKAIDAKTSERRKQLMPLINRAYNEQDIETLERLSLGETELHVREKTATEKQKALQTELRRLNRAASQLRFEINRLKAGRTYQLKQQVETAKKMGTDLLTTLAKDLERKIKASRGQLVRLINMWHRSK
ncbi:J domain-containing protein [Candidatus Poribacteria bacterium]|nr:J domain-containing protein [Candidatus Poribacteria bacterium]